MNTFSRLSRMSILDRITRWLDGQRSAPPAVQDAAVSFTKSQVFLLAQLDEREGQLNRRDADLARQAQEIGLREAELYERQQGFEKQIKQKREQIRRREQQVNEREQDMARRQQQIIEMYESNIKHLQRIQRETLVRVAFDDIEDGHWLLPDAGESLDEIVRVHMLREALSIVLGQLSDKERRVLELRYGLGPNDGDSHTLSETAEIMGLSSGRIHQIETKALRKLRHPYRSRHLRDYLG